MVLHRSLVDCRGCMLLYMKHIWYSGFSRDLCSIGGGVGSICHGYMCIVQNMKFIWCHGFPEIYAQLEEGVGSIYHLWVYVHCAIHETYVVYWFSRVLCWIGGGGVGQLADLPNLNSFTFHALLHRRSFCITYERPNYTTKTTTTTYRYIYINCSIFLWSLVFWLLLLLCNIVVVFVIHL